MAKIIAALFLFSPLVTSDLLGLPTVPFVEDGGHLSLSKLGRIIVDAEHCDIADTTGHTLIPPTLLEFANTFASDLEATGSNTEVVAGDHAEEGSIFLTIGNSSEFIDAAGRWTAEAYTLNVTDDRIIITGASPLGAWWATRSVFQQRALNGTIATGYGVDAPGWGTRGIMVCLLMPRCTGSSWKYMKSFLSDLASSTVAVTTTRQSSSSNSAPGSRTGSKTSSTFTCLITSTTTRITPTSSRWNSMPVSACFLTTLELRD